MVLAARITAGRQRGLPTPNCHSGYLRRNDDFQGATAARSAELVGGLSSAEFDADIHEPPIIFLDEPSLHPGWQRGYDFAESEHAQEP